MSGQTLAVRFNLRRTFVACAFLLCALGTAAHAQTDNASPGAITGRVVDEAGQPIANAQIFVNSPRGSANTSSDLDGRFNTDTLPRSAYTVSANAPGYFNLSSLASERGERTYYQSGDAITIRLGKGGVITGRVTNAGGDPLIAAHVDAIRIRPLEGQLDNNAFARIFERTTDDRGVYRFYGLLPGVYLVSAGGQGMFGFNPRPTPYDDDAPIFYPATTRDGATEITIQAGQEATDIDIHYRGEPGPAVSGAIINGQSLDNSSLSLSLFPARSNYLVSSRYIAGRSNDQSFVFNGIGDGDYDLVAEQYGRDGRSAAVSQRVSVQGKDVTGLKLTLAPLSSIAGRVVLEAAPAGAAWREQCTSKLDAVASETTLNLRREPEARADAAHFGGARSTDAAPDAKGEFHIRGLAAGRFHLAVRPPNSDWYVRTATLAPVDNARTSAPTTTSRASAQPAPPAIAANTNPLLDGLKLAAGAQVNGLTLTLAPGAAALRGHVTAASEGAALPELEIYLVPAERERADDALRYAVARVRNDGAFGFTHLAPGRYQLLARPAPPRTQSADEANFFLLPDAQTRAQIRRAAETTDVIELQPCQRRNDYVLRYTPTK
ncbi:MAG TPA: carboxypeptidase-like regulatory domain-containing protein, partial [Pyrinomonadaceae bacterium]|nr:carboxypeptidase-like regulatory domain-containing protein [Pyrinomonadaceae bacterium]